MLHPGCRSFPVGRPFEGGSKCRDSAGCPFEGISDSLVVAFRPFYGVSCHLQAGCPCEGVSRLPIMTAGFPFEGDFRLPLVTAGCPCEGAPGQALAIHARSSEAIITGLINALARVFLGVRGTTCFPRSTAKEFLATKSVNLGGDAALLKGDHP